MAQNIPFFLLPETHGNSLRASSFHKVPIRERKKKRKKFVSVNYILYLLFLYSPSFYVLSFFSSLCSSFFIIIIFLLASLWIIPCTTWLYIYTCTCTYTHIIFILSLFYFFLLLFKGRVRKRSKKRRNLYSLHCQNYMLQAVEIHPVLISLFVCQWLFHVLYDS